MSDPNRYIRKAVIEALRTAGIEAYEQTAPGSATPPYALVSVTMEGRQVKGPKFYRATISIDLYNEFREDGGKKAIDELADDVLDIMVPATPPYLVMSGYQHVNCRLASSDERLLKEDSVTTFIRILRFESLITE